jgi:hypothetical protein
MQTLCLHQRPRFLRDLSPVRVSDLSAKPSKHGHENSLASAKRKCMHESIQRVHRKQQLCMRVGGLCAVRASAISISRLSTHACKKRAKATVSGEQKKRHVTHKCLLDGCFWQKDLRQRKVPHCALAAPVCKLVRPRPSALIL